MEASDATNAQWTVAVAVAKVRFRNDGDPRGALSHRSTIASCSFGLL
jgi:hypothetical protein